MRDIPGDDHFGFDRLSLFFVIAATAIAAMSARPDAPSWNDRSRLAAVESLVDRHTWVIDDSFFARTSPNPTSRNPLMPNESGTADKMWINRHFYSDKAPVPSLALAVVYRLIQLATGLVARQDPGKFCYWLTLLSSGLAYVISVWCIDRLAVLHRLRLPARILVTASFALGTIALAYSRHVNSHILSLATCSALLVLVCETEIFSVGRLIAIGSLLGATYSLDVVVGCAMVLGAVGLIGWQTRRWSPIVVILAAAFPWFALHHVLNYMIGGTFVPANANPEFFQWPGSPFKGTTLTGSWQHRSVWKFASYAFDLLLGHRGFLLCDLTLLLAVAGAVWLVRRNIPKACQVWFAMGVSILSWLVYSIASANHSGECFSIRWFVPLLAPAYLILVILLRHNARAEAQLRIVAIGSIAIGVLAWWQGPWDPRIVPGFWFIVGATCVAWLILSWRQIGRRLPEIVNQERHGAVAGPVGTE